MMARSSFSLRRLVNQLRDSDSDDENNESPLFSGELDDMAAFAAATAANTPRRSRSWMPSNRPASKGTKKSPKPIIIIRRSEDLHRISAIPPLPHTPKSMSGPRSSRSSSLYEGQRHYGARASEPRTPPLRHSGSRNRAGGGASLYSRPSTKEGSPDMRSRSSHESHHGEDAGLVSFHGTSPQQRRFQEQKPLPSPPDSSKSTFDLLEALLIPPQQAGPHPDLEGPRTPPNIPLLPPPGTPLEWPRTPPKIPIPDRLSSAAVDANKENAEAWSSNLQQLIRQTDKPSPENAQANQDVFPEVSRCNTTRANLILTPPTSPKTVHKKPLPRAVKPPVDSLTRSASASKIRRKKSKSKKPSPRRKSTKTGSNSSRWTLTENAKELLFNRGIFSSRIEADEVLSPATLQEIRMSRSLRFPEYSSNSRPLSTETRRSSTAATTDTDGSETPIDSFHLQDLPTRIGAAGVRLSNVMTPIVEVPTPRSFAFAGEEEGVVRRDFSVPSQRHEESPKKAEPIEASMVPAPLQVNKPGADDRQNILHKQPEQQRVPLPQSPHPMVYKSMSFPSPPLRHPARLIPRKPLPQPPVLPTIPEVMTTPSQSAADSTNLFPEDDAADRGYIYLPSTPYTFNAPGFRHGPIRLSKAELTVTMPWMRVPDETLDWTAFQMAISGGAGDFFSGPTDFTQRDEADDLAADVCSWFAEFGFEGAGRLVSVADKEEEDGAKTPTSSSSRRTRSSHSRSPGSKRKRSRASPASPSSSSGLASPASPSMNLPIPVDTEHPSGFWNAGAPDADSTSRFRTLQFQGVRRWTVEGHPRRFAGHSSTRSTASSGGRGLRINSDVANSSPSARSGAATGGIPGTTVSELRRGSADSNHGSLPPSPMLDLVVSRDASGREYVVPMGYNLGHDLGDFLRWEAEHVNPGGYFGSHSS